MPIAPLALFAPNGPLWPLLGLREPVSGITHLAAALLSVCAGATLWRRCRGDRPKQISMAVYAASLVILYAASATYHLVDLPPDRLVPFRKLDHAAIFLLIAGTFTSFFFNATRGWWRLGPLLAIWGLAVAGISLKVAFIDMPDAVSAGLYVGMGWLAVIAYRELAATLSHRAMALTLLGGVLYTAGAAADVLQWPVPVPGIFGFHETFHVLVMLASAVQFAVVHAYVAPSPRHAFRGERVVLVAAAA